MKRAISGLLAGTFLCICLNGCLQKKKSSEVMEAPPQSVQTASNEKATADLEAFLAGLERDRALYLEALEAKLSALEAKETTAPESNYRFETKNGAIVITEYIGSDTEVTVPAMLDGLPVLTIGEYAFRGKKVRSVIVPEGVRTLDWFSFYECSALESVTLPASLTMVEYGAFDGCRPSLTVACPTGSYAAAWAVGCGLHTEQS